VPFYFVYIITFNSNFLKLHILNEELRQLEETKEERILKQ